ncbi:DUF1877 family protein [Streptomyces sp. NPDC050636]|uniref:DUF1877 family protein n=1 Tax=Streptomyces sp. NPDC050636 TaxID=3154510 RepID=UPI003423FB87
MRLDFLMDGFPILEDGTLFGWTAEQVESVARELRATSWERLAAHYDPERMEKERGYPPGCRCGGSLAGRRCVRRCLRRAGCRPIRPAGCG